MSDEVIVVKCYGYKTLRSWFEVEPDGTWVGWGEGRTYDLDGNLLSVNRAPTGLRFRMEAGK